jgi:hypothetical protein
MNLRLKTTAAFLTLAAWSAAAQPQPAPPYSISGPRGLAHRGPRDKVIRPASIPSENTRS